MIDLDPQLRIAMCAAIWTALLMAAFQTLRRSRQGSVGLPVALILLTTVMHAGGLVHLVDGYDHNANTYLQGWAYSIETVAVGTEISLIGIFGFVAGGHLVNLVMAAPRRSGLGPTAATLVPAARFLIATGLWATAVMTLAGSVIGGLSGLTAVLGGFKNVFLFGAFGLTLHFALADKPRNAILAAAAAAIVSVGIQVIFGGILGDSVGAAIIVLSFLLIVLQARIRSSFKRLMYLGLACYALLIASLGWLEIRTEIRTVVYDETTTVSQRLDATWNALFNVDILGKITQSQLEYLDMRMNHNVTIGKTVEMLHARPDLFAEGETLVQASFAWVPRLFWPEKPERGGSATASKYMGLQLSDTSSFGTGPIFDFYINFGAIGVLFGSIFYGIVIRWLDARSAQVFASGDLLAAVPYFAAGVNMVTAFESNFFVVNGVVTSALAGMATLLLARVWKQLQLRSIDAR